MRNHVVLNQTNQPQKTTGTRVHDPENHPPVRLKSSEEFFDNAEYCPALDEFRQEMQKDAGKPITMYDIDPRFGIEEGEWLEVDGPGVGVLFEDVPLDG